ncbi:integrase, partial [Escherichia coli]|nr:integrase [Escherichia coli]MPU42388.1 integrase [Escherichia coli]
ELMTPVDYILRESKNCNMWWTHTLCCNDNVSRLFLSCSGSRLAPVMLSGAYLQRAGVFSLQQPMPPGIKPPQHCASPEPFRLDADSTTVFLFRNLSLLHSVLRIPQNIIRLQPLHFSYEKGRRVSPLRPGPGANCHYGSLTPA